MFLHGSWIRDGRLDRSFRGIDSEPTILEQQMTFSLTVYVTAVLGMPQLQKKTAAAVYLSYLKPLLCFLVDQKCCC